MNFIQKKGVDYHEVFSPISKKDLFKVIIVLVAHFDLKLYQMDVKTIFLNEDLEEEVYMCRLEGFDSKMGNY